MTKTKLQKVREMCTTKNFLIFSIVAIIVFSFMFMMIVPMFANNGNGVLDRVVDQVITIIKMAARYIGIIVSLWGAFQIILAMRREDSEGISKQVTTIVIGALLVGISIFIDPIVAALRSAS